MINSHVRLVNGIVRFARCLAYGLTSGIVVRANNFHRVGGRVRLSKRGFLFTAAGLEGLEIRDDDETQRGLNIWNPANENPGTWNENRGRRLRELSDLRLKDQINTKDLMEYMLLGSGLDDLLYDSAKNVLRRTRPELYKIMQELAQKLNADFTDEDFASLKISPDEEIDWDKELARWEKDKEALVKRFEKRIDDKRTGPQGLTTKEAERDAAEKALDDCNADLKDCQGDIKILESGDEPLLDDEVQELADLKALEKKLLNKQEDLQKQVSVAQAKVFALKNQIRALTTRKDFLEGRSNTDIKEIQGVLEQLRSRFREFKDFVDNESAAKLRIFNYLISHSDAIFRKVLGIKVPSMTDPEDLMHGMAIALMQALTDWLQNGEFVNRVSDAFTRNMQNIASGGSVEGFPSVDKFLMFCGSMLKDSAGRMMEHAKKVPQMKAPIRGKDEEEETPWEDFVRYDDPRSGSDFETANKSDALSTWLSGVDDAESAEEYDPEASRDRRRQELIDEMKVVANDIFASNPLEKALFNQYISKTDYKKLVNGQFFNLGNNEAWEDLYKNLLNEAKTNSNVLEFMRQKKLGEQEKAILDNMSYADLMRNEEIPAAFKARVINKDGTPVLVRSLATLRSLASTETTENIREKLPEIILGAVQNLGKKYDALKDVINSEGLSNALSKFFSKGNASLSEAERKRRKREDPEYAERERQLRRERDQRKRLEQRQGVKSSINVRAELLRIARLLQSI